MFTGSRTIPSQLVLVLALVVGGGAGAACGSGSEPGASVYVAGTEAGPGLPGAPDADNFGDVSSGPVGPVDALEFDPPEITVTCDGTGPQTASYALKATVGSTTVKVTPQSIQFDWPDLAAAQLGVPVVLTASGIYAGTGVLHGVYGGKDATAKLHVVVHLTDVGAGVAAGAVTAIGAGGLAADTAVTSLLYPYDKTVFPLGISSPLLMWAAPKAGDVYRVHLEEQGFTYDGYSLAPPPAQVRVPQDAWDRVTASNAGDALKLTLSRWDSVSHTAYDSAAQTWTVAPASLRGAIYYWTTSGTGHMSRIRPGTGAQPEVLFGGQCVGCHGVSADGTTLAASVAAAASTDDTWTTTRGWASYDLPAGTVRKQTSSFGGNVALNPNGKYVVYGGGNPKPPSPATPKMLKLADTATGTPLTSGLETFSLDATMTGFMTPAFSPDGKKFAAVEGKGTWYHDMINGKLVVADFDEATHAFSGLVGLAAASSFPASQRAINYPSFAPDSANLAFHVSDVPTGCNPNCLDGETQIGSLWVQSIKGAAPVRLDTLNDTSATAADHNLSFEPTFNPVERGGYYWVVFTSMRDWGNRIVGAPNNGKKRLWVAAIDKAMGATDPSHPPFFLDGQEESTTNMRGFWALAQCTPTPAPGAGGGACAAGFECCSGFCDHGVCVDTGTIACKGVGETCQLDQDCCNSDVVSCIKGICATVDTK